MKPSMTACLLAGLLACGGGQGSSNPEQPGTDDGAADVTRTCIDQSGAATACPVPVTAAFCPGNDSSACFTQTVEEIAQAPDGPCLRIAFRNGCAHVVYSESCIEYSKNGKTPWQCWTSTTQAGDVLDAAQCGATGRYTHAQSESDAQLDVLEAQCPHP